MVLATTLAVACLLLSARVPTPFILPTLSVLVLAGFGMAAALYLAGSRPSRTLSALWEVARSLIFLGFAAGILGDAMKARARVAWRP